MTNKPISPSQRKRKLYISLTLGFAMSAFPLFALNHYAPWSTFVDLRATSVALSFWAALASAAMVIRHSDELQRNIFFRGCAYSLLIYAVLTVAVTSFGIADCSDFVQFTFIGGVIGDRTIGLLYSCIAGNTIASVVN